MENTRTRQINGTSATAVVENDGEPAKPPKISCTNGTLHLGKEILPARTPQAELRRRRRRRRLPAPNDISSGILPNLHLAFGQMFSAAFRNHFFHPKQEACHCFLSLHATHWPQL